MMKTLLLLILFSTTSMALPIAMISNLEGDVKVNGLEISEKTKLDSGYKITVAKGEKSFAVIAFNNGQRILILSGEVILEKLSALGSKMMLNHGEVYFHVINPDNRLLDSIFQVKTKTSIYDLHGGDSYFNKSNEKIFFAQMKGITKYNDPWGKINVKKGLSLKSADQNRAPISSPIPYKLWRRIKVGFDRMGVSLD